MAPPTPRIAAARTPEDFATVRELFTEYAQSLGFSLCFQGFDQELATLPGRYAPPEGTLLLATVEGRPVGVVGLRSLGEGVCEMKRLYVRPEGRGLKLGRALADAVIAAARERGYRAMRLDTLAKMAEANALYDRLGFRDIPPYYANPLPDTRYRELTLL
jgi:ribosomal protein S18 acetylase RimI-like enzyme